MKKRGKGHFFGQEIQSGSLNTTQVTEIFIHVSKENEKRILQIA